MKLFKIDFHAFKMSNDNFPNNIDSHYECFSNSLLDALNLWLEHCYFCGYDCYFIEYILEDEPIIKGE